MPSNRIDLLDLLRSLALVGMIAFHLSYDMLMFGLISASYASTDFFYFHARVVAGTFILTAGLGLYLAHASAIRWPSFWRRFSKIAAAAALVTIATKFAMPQAYVYFGILHAIALFSLLGLAVLRLSSLGSVLLAAAFISGSYWLRAPVFDLDLLRFVGLSGLPAYTIDFEPIFPWFGIFLLGISLGQVGQTHGLWVRLSEIKSPAWATWAGRHSLPIYLIHQPILLGLVWTIAQLT